MTLPRVLKLKKLNNEIFLTNYPVKEVSMVVNDLTIAHPQNGQPMKLPDPSASIDVQLSGGSFAGLTLRFSNSLNEEVVISFSDELVSFDRSKSGITNFEKGFGAKHDGELVIGSAPSSLRVFIDAASIELFVNQGELVMTELVFPTVPYDKFILSWNGESFVQKVAMGKVTGIW